MSQEDNKNNTLFLKPYSPDVNNTFNEGPFTFSKLLALISILIYALIYNIICTPLGWFGIIITAIGYKLIAK
jgi:hypothetical protein